MFMADSERAATLSLSEGIEVGLHINFSEKFTLINVPSNVYDQQERLSRFLKKNKYSGVVYNPFLRKEFEFVYRVQYEEFLKLYRKTPAHINGHRHMHLCTNVLFDGLICKKSRVRKSFSFRSGEKNFINRCYRSIVDAWIKRKFICTDFFFSIAPIEDAMRLGKKIELAKWYNVELMVHPQKPEEFEFLMGSQHYSRAINNVMLGTFEAL
jgi:predicted glycoside hydrolase/deacetylase ChbG (UPF0249 family)